MDTPTYTHEMPTSTADLLVFASGPCARFERRRRRGDGVFGVPSYVRTPSEGGCAAN